MTNATDGGPELTPYNEVGKITQQLVAAANRGNSLPAQIAQLEAERQKQIAQIIDHIYKLLEDLAFLNGPTGR
jgi:hypothetical protein